MKKKASARRPLPFKSVSQEQVSALIATRTGKKSAGKKEHRSAFIETFERYLQKSSNKASCLFTEKFYASEIESWHMGTLCDCFSLVFQKTAPSPQHPGERYYIWAAILYELQKRGILETNLLRQQEIQGSGKSAISPTIWSKKQESRRLAALACDYRLAPAGEQARWKKIIEGAAERSASPLSSTDSDSDSSNNFLENDTMATAKKTSAKKTAPQKKSAGASASAKKPLPPKKQKSGEQKNGHKGALDFAAEILKKSGKPMTHAELKEAVLKAGFKTRSEHFGFSNDTNNEIRERGSESRFRKVKRGLYEYALKN